MNNLKRKVSLILSVILIALSIFPLGMSLATVNTVTSMDVTMDGKTIKNGGTYEVKGGEKIEAMAQSPNGVDFIGYYYNGVTEIKDFDGNKLSITVPTNPAGTELDLRIEAVDSKNNQTGWYKFILKYPAVDDLSLSAKMDGVSLVSGKSYDVKGGETVTVKAKSSNGVASMKERQKLLMFSLTQQRLLFQNMQMEQKQNYILPQQIRLIMQATGYLTH